MADVGDIVRYRVHERHKTKTVKAGQNGPRERIEIEGSTFHHLHREFAGVIAAAADPLPPADGKGKATPQFILGLFVPDKAMVYVQATEGKAAGQFEVRG